MLQHVDSCRYKWSRLDIPLMEAEALMMGLKLAENWTSVAIHTMMCSRFVHDRTDPAMHALEKVETNG